METRSTAKRKASIESYGILTRNQKQKLGVSLPTFQENNVTSKRKRKMVVETKMLQDQESAYDGTPPAKGQKLEIKEESAFILPYRSICSPASAVPLQGETSSCSRPHESVFEHQRSIHSERDPQESVLFSPEIMEKIFRILDLSEQNNFRLVCKEWYKMAHKYWSRCNWFNCREEIEQLKRMSKDDLNGCFESLLSLIKERPLLKRITCNLDDRGQNSEVIEAVLLYVEDLHHIDMGYATLSQVKCLVNKYKNLRSVSLHVTSRNIVESVKCLGKCEKFLNLMFTKGKDCKDDHIERNFPAVCRAIAENYPKLLGLLLKPAMSLHMSEQLEYLLRRRSTAFTHLYLEFHKYSNDIGNVLGLCTNLKVLRLRLHSPDIPFQLPVLNKLKKLCIRFEGSNTREVVGKTLDSIQCKGLQTHQFYLYLNIPASIDLPLSASNHENARTRRLLVFDKSTAMNKLNDMSDMQNTTHITIKSRYIPESIARCIAKCKSLQFLVLEQCTLTEPALLELKHCTSLKAVELVDTKLTLNSFIQVVKSLPNVNFIYTKVW